MAAGDIILPDGTVIPVSAQQQIAAAVKEMIAAESKDLTQYEEVDSIDNVSSLPGLRVSGSVATLVRVALSVLKGVDGKTPEITADATAIKWRYQGASDWNTLVQLSLLKGDKGDKGEKVMIRKGSTGIEWKYESGSQWQTLVPIADLSFTYDELTDEQKQEISKKPVLSAVEAAAGETASGEFTADGTDENGNPKYKLRLTLPKGDKGDTGVTDVSISTLQPGQAATATLQGDTLVLGIPQGEKGEAPTLEAGQSSTGEPGTDVELTITPNGETESGSPKYLVGITVPKGDKGEPPVLEIGTVTTLEPTQQATASVVADGETSDGKPKYKINLGLPKGNPGDGNGNVYVETTGLVQGKQYVFQPSSDGSATGQFVEIAVPDETVYITHAESQIPSEGDIVNIGQADHEKLVYAIKNNLDIVVRTMCTSFKAYGVYNYESDDEMFQVFFHFPLVSSRDSTSHYMGAEKRLNYINGYCDVPLTPNEEGTYDLVFHHESPYIIFDVDLSQATEEGVQFESIFEYDLDAFVESRRVAFCAKAPTASESKNGLIMFNLVFSNENLGNDNLLKYVFKSDSISTDVNGYTTTACYEIHVDKDGSGILYKVDTATKETGNVTTHRHDTVYATEERETDVWDGTSVSDHLEGTGTKDDPYLIQSCADWVYLHNHAYEFAQEGNIDDIYDVSTTFKLTKNLDFNDKAINITSDFESLSSKIINFAEYDGNRCEISNYHTSILTGNGTPFMIGLLPFSNVYPVVHDFSFKNITLELNQKIIEDGTLSLWGAPSHDVYSTIFNNIYDLHLGYLSYALFTKNKEIPILLSNLTLLYQVENVPFKERIDYLLETRGNYMSVSFSTGSYTSDTSEGNDLYVLYNANTSSVCTVFDTSLCELPSELEDGFPANRKRSVALCSLSDKVYIDNTSSRYLNYAFPNVSSGATVKKEGIGKSEDEMQSAEFVEELNSYLPVPAFKQDPDGGMPILNPLSDETVYNGYVSQSLFDSFRSTMMEKLNDSYIYTLPREVYDLPSGASQAVILEALGGQEVVNKLMDIIKRKGKVVMIDKTVSSTYAKIPVDAGYTAYSELQLHFHKYPADVTSDHETGYDVYVGYSSNSNECYVKHIYPGGYTLNPKVYSFTSSSTSNDILAAVGGESGMKDIIQAVKDGNRLVIRGTDDSLGTEINQDLMCNIYKKEDNGDMFLMVYGYGYGLFGGIGGLLQIQYTKSSNTFSVQLLSKS